MAAAAVILGVIALSALAAWIGEVVTLNFIIIPSVKALDEEGRAAFIARYFPRFFAMATVLSLTTVLAGLAARLTAAGAPAVTNPILTGGSPPVIAGLILIAVLACFHMVAQARMRPAALSLAENPNPEKLRSITRFISIVPRIALAVILCAFVLLAAQLLSA